VASSSGKVINFFTSTKSEYSTRTDLIDSDYHSVNRLYGSKGTILTISLNDLLLTHDVPTAIDYISIDTEGSELEILSTFDFNKYKVRLWTVEHNHRHDETEIDKLFISKGYQKINKNFGTFESWYKLSYS
jgi:hypothetical protein